MPQGVLPFQYQEETSSAEMTALAGLPIYLDLAYVAGLSQSIQRHLKLRERKQGWSDGQIITSLVLLNLAGGDSVEDLGILEKDAGFGQVLRRVEHHGLGRKERRSLQRRWRKERHRTVPSPSAVFRYLWGFHDGEEEQQRQPHQAFIPAPNAALRGLGKVNADPSAPLRAGSGSLRPGPVAAAGSHPGPGRHSGGNPQARCSLLLPGVPSLSAPEHLLGGTGPGNPLGVPGR